MQDPDSARRVQLGVGVFDGRDQYREGVWVASYGDGSAYVPFRTEIEALRYAVANHMSVELVPWGPPDA